MQRKLGKEGFPVTKEEILAKSREENTGMDEREQQVMLQSHSASNLAGLVLCILIHLINRITGGPEVIRYAAWTILWGMLAAALWTNFLKLKNRKSWIVPVLYTVSFLLNGAAFLAGSLNHG